MSNVMILVKEEFIMEIYVVTQGEYSDYHICGVADTMEKAQKLVKFFEKPDYPADIETYDTDDIQCVEDKKWWKVTYTLSLTETEKRVLYGGNSIHVDEEALYNIGELYRDSEISEGIDRYGHNYFRANITAKDKEHALKIFYDKLAEYIARQQGIAI